MGLCCAGEERGETPGREDTPSDLVEADLDPGGHLKTAEDKAFGRNTAIYFILTRLFIPCPSTFDYCE